MKFTDYNEIRMIFDDMVRGCICDFALERVLVIIVPADLCYKTIFVSHYKRITDICCIQVFFHYYVDRKIITICPSVEFIGTILKKPEPGSSVN